MDIRVSGHQVATGDAFKSHASTRMQAIADKHFARAVSANVTLGNGPHDNGFICDIFMPVTQGLVLKGSGRSTGEANQAFDMAAERIEKQLRRYMRRLKDRHGPGARVGAGGSGGGEDDFQFNADYTVFRGEEAEEPSDNPVVVAETKVDVPTASVSDAVMMLDLRNTTALLFKNGQTGVLNMVYRREDGNIGWVEPGR